MQEAPKKLSANFDQCLETVCAYVLQEFERDPLTKLRRYADEAGLRLIDLFKQFDKDNSWSVDRDEFLMGVKVFSFNINTNSKKKITLFQTFETFNISFLVRQHSTYRR